MGPGSDCNAALFDYVVQKKDTLADIVRRYDVSIRELMRLNETCDLFGLKEGLVIRVPLRDARYKRPYRLGENEDLFFVARKFNKSVLSLLRANPHLWPLEFTEGMRIALPE